MGLCCVKCPAEGLAPGEGSVNSLSSDSSSWQGFARFLALVMELALQRFGDGGPRDRASRGPQG